MTGRTILPPALVAVAMLLACAAALLAVSAREADAAFPGANGRIAFVSERDGASGIYAMQPDGSGVQQVVDDVPPGGHSPSSAGPEWSPDGSKIVFSRSDGRDDEVFVKDLASGDVAQVTDNQTYQDPYEEESPCPGGCPIDDYDPAWSPDGSEIVFMRFHDSSEGYSFSLHVMDADGSGERQIGQPYFGQNPEWSPDGSKIALSVYDSDFFVIVVVDVNSGSGLRSLHDKPAGSTSIFSDTDPEWSPDGRRMLYTSEELVDWDTVSRDVWVMDADGSDKRRLTDTPENEGAPQWSPDGSKIAFRRTATAEYRSAADIWTMDADGTNQANVTDSPDNEGYLDWGPQCPCPAPPSPDEADPTIVSLRPASGADIRDRTPTVAATVRDGEGELKGSDIELRIDGARRSFSYDPATDRLKRTTGRLPYGRHSVEVTATDPLGNEATKNWTFRVVRGR